MLDRLDATAATMTPGAALKSLRIDRGWTLKEVSDRTGIPVSTLSKAENGKSDLGLERVLKITVAMGVNVADVFGSPRLSEALDGGGRRVVTKSGDCLKVQSPYGEYSYHAMDFLGRAFTPMVAEIKAKTLEEFGELHRHSGQEYVLVLEGELVIHSEGYAPLSLKPGESVYFDSSMGHAYLAAGDAPCKIVSIFSTSSAQVYQRINMGTKSRR